MKTGWRICVAAACVLVTSAAGGAKIVIGPRYRTVWYEIEVRTGRTDEVALSGKDIE